MKGFFSLSSTCDRRRKMGLKSYWPRISCVKPFPQQQVIVILWKSRWHVDEFTVPASTYRNLHLLWCFCYCFITCLRSAFAKPWRELKPLKGLPCQVSSHIWCHAMRCYHADCRRHSCAYSFYLFSEKKRLNIEIQMFKGCDSILLLTSLASFWEPDFCYSLSTVM